MNQGKRIDLTDTQRAELERRERSQTLDARSVRRAKIVLLAADGVGNYEIARRLEISRGQVIAWRGRFADGGIKAIASDLPRSGRKALTSSPRSPSRKHRLPSARSSGKSPCSVASSDEKVTANRV